MSSWQSIKHQDNNIQAFKKNIKGINEIIYAPICLAKRYYIEDILSAEGGFGIIYIARDSRVCDRKVLIKSRRYDKETGLFMYKNDVKRAKKIYDIRQQTEFEIECLKAFKGKGESRMPTLNDVVEGISPSIKGPHKDSNTEEFYEYTEEDIYLSEPYIIMQYIEGENLLHYSKSRVEEIKEDLENTFLIKRWEYDTIRFALEISTIMKAFHKLQECESKEYKGKFYIYQDLKPHNIIITEGNFLTLLDFGGMLEVWVDKYGNNKSNILYRGNPGVSTYGYRAPELTRGSYELTRLDGRVDVYSLGATLFGMLIGEDLVTVVKDEKDRLPLERLRELGYGEKTIDFIDMCTKHNKEERYQSMDEITSVIYNSLFRSIKSGE